MSRSAWQLPPGVSRGTWDYAEAEHIARDYDQYFADASFLNTTKAFASAATFKARRCCRFWLRHTGRALLPLMRQGHSGLAIDLSAEMLSVVKEKARAGNLPVTLVRAI